MTATACREGMASRVAASRGACAQVGSSGEVVRMGLVRSQPRPARPAALYDWDLAVAARAAASVRAEAPDSAQTLQWSAGALTR